MPITASILQRAIPIYLQIAYGQQAVPEVVQQRISTIMALAPDAAVPENLFERDAANSLPVYALRLGQPTYPFMKLAVEPAPCAGTGTGSGYLLRVDTHDRHLHAAPGSPDAQWLASVRANNREITDKIEASWSQAGLPTFKEFLRKQVEARKAQRFSTPSEGSPGSL